MYSKVVWFYWILALLQMFTLTPSCAFVHISFRINSSWLHFYQIWYLELKKYLFNINTLQERIGSLYELVNIMITDTSFNVSHNVLIEIVISILITLIKSWCIVSELLKWIVIFQLIVIFYVYYHIWSFLGLVFIGICNHL